MRVPAHLDPIRGEDGAPDYYLIVPILTEQLRAEWGGYGEECEGATSMSDGLANTRALLADTNEHPAAKLASEFTADGHSDFYLPARRELQAAEANVPELFEKAYHWSSSQFSANTAYYVAFEVGWLNYGDSPAILTVGQTGSYWIDTYAVNNPASAAPKALKILKSVDGNGKPTWYYVESRAKVGFDSGLTAGVVGCLVGGLLLGVGLGLAVQGAHIGWLLVLPAGPVAGVLGYILARRLARKLPRTQP